MDQDNFRTILSWPPYTIATKVRIFHDLAQFYRKLIRNFSGIFSLVLHTIRGGMKENIRLTLEKERILRT